MKHDCIDLIFKSILQQFYVCFIHSNIFLRGQMNFFSLKVNSQILFL
jgi:hypothetical protein